MSDVAAPPRCPVCGLEIAGNVPDHCPRPSCGVELSAGTPGRLKIGTFRLVDHYSLCVLPFSFGDAEGEQIAQRLTASGRWQEQLFSLNNPADVDRTEYFLPYIRRFLFPSLFANASANDPARRAQTCWHFQFDLTRLGAAAKSGLPITMKVRDDQKPLECEYPLLLEKIELIVFTFRVAFIVLHFRNDEARPSYFDQMHALSYLRTIAPLYHGFEMPELTAGTQRFRMTQLLPYLLGEFGDVAPPASPASVPLSAPLPVKPSYDDRMMVYTFSCLDKNSALADEQRCQGLLYRAAVVNFDPHDTTRPAEGRVGDERAWMHFRWQAYTKDGGSLVVFNTDRFHAKFLGGYHATYYFDIFLLAALQRVTLLSLFESFSDIHTLITASAASRKLLRRVRRDLLLFKNQCWFSQITNRERGLVLWKKWQKILETRTLLREVNEQSEELNNYLQNRYRERIEWLVRLGSFLAAAIPTVLGLERFLGSEPWVAQLRWALLLVLIVGTLVFGWFVLLKQRDEV